MPVDQASYRPFEGERHARRFPALAITTSMVSRRLKSKMVRWVSQILPLMGVAMLTVIFTMFYMMDTGGPFGRLMRRRGLEELNLLALTNRWWYQNVGFLALLLAALAGAPLIAEDRRARALPLYFARPIRPIDYVLGKWFALVFLMGTLLVIPPVLLYLTEISLSPVAGIASAQLSTLGRSLVPAFALLVVLSAVALGVSSLVKRTNHAVLGIFGVMLGVKVIAVFLARQVFREELLYALDPVRAADRLAVLYLPLPGALERFSNRAGEFSEMACWTSLACWTAAGLLLLVLHVRRTEVVS